MENVSKLKCSICDSILKTETAFKYHIESVHGGKKPFQCSICGEVFTRKDGMTNHIQAIHEDEKPFKCQDCGSYFSIQGNLRKHISNVHEKNKLFHCKICKSRFSTKQSLIGHSAAVHEGKKIHCPFCDKTFKWAGGFKDHVNSTHKGNERSKQYQWSVWNKDYKFLESLKYHQQNIHEDRKYINCIECDTKFTTKQGLNQHIKVIHKGENLINAKYATNFAKVKAI